MDWVQKMSDAMRNLNYQGDFVYLHENRLEGMRISHYRDEHGEKERLISLNGEAREVIRDNQNLTCIWPSSVFHRFLSPMISSGWENSTI